MYKRLFLLLLIVVPIASYSQQAVSHRSGPSTEIGFALSSTPDNQGNSFSGGCPRFSLSLLRNRNHLQYGLTLEAGSNTIERKYLTPALLLNYRTTGRSGYWYAGVMAGYYTVKGYAVSRYYPDPMRFHGYAFGLQTGYVQRIYKRLSLQAEISVRSCQTWEYFESTHLPDPSVPNSQPFVLSYRGVNSMLYIPVGVGIRYQF